jgi:hypothetical protein
MSGSDIAFSSGIQNLLSEEDCGRMLDVMEVNYAICIWLMEVET